jgi:hypothetical protein
MSQIKARITPNQKLLVTNYRLNANTLRLSDIFDVEASNAQSGGLLIYNATTELWEAENIVENPGTQINGGDY